MSCLGTIYTASSLSRGIQPDACVKESVPCQNGNGCVAIFKVSYLSKALSCPLLLKCAIDR